MLIVLMVVSLPVISQENPAGLQIKARQYMHTNKIDSACIIFERIRQKFPDYDKAYIFSELAEIYLWYKNDTVKAEQNYLGVLGSNGIYLNRNSCLQLANIYIGQKKYKLALSYLQKPKKSFPIFLIPKRKNGYIKPGWPTSLRSVIKD